MIENKKVEFWRVPKSAETADSKGDSSGNVGEKEVKSSKLNARIKSGEAPRARLRIS